MEWTDSAFYPIDTTFYVAPLGSELSLHYLYWALRNLNLLNLSADSAVPGLNRNYAYYSPAVVPSNAAAHAFGELARSLRSQWALNDHQSRSLAQLLNLLLPRLLSGELSIRAAEEAVGAAV